MNKEKPLSEIEAELYEALASKELTPWCKVSVKGIPWRFLSGLSNGGVGMVVALGGVTMDLSEKWIHKNVKIIGHEPTLNDVLLRLGEAKDEWSYEVDNFGGIHKSRYDECGECVRKHIGMYDLTKSFDNQTEETKRKLHDLICN